MKVSIFRFVLCWREGSRVLPCENARVGFSGPFGSALFVCNCYFCCCRDRFFHPLRENARICCCSMLEILFRRAKMRAAFWVPEFVPPTLFVRVKIPLSALWFVFNVSSSAFARRAGFGHLLGERVFFARPFDCCLYFVVACAQVEFSPCENARFDLFSFFCERVFVA